MPVVTFLLDNNKKCSGIIRSSGVQITTLEGRIQPLTIDFETYPYNELQMRRKAEILQYKHTDTTSFTKGQTLAYQAKNKGPYSQARIQQLIALRATNEDTCPIIATPATNSGIKGDNKTLLYRNPSFPLLLK
jgi:hypothetical protein